MTTTPGRKIPGSIIAEVAALALILLFGYTAVSKLYDWTGTYRAFHNQVFPSWMAGLLLVTVPLLELTAVLCLLVPAWRHRGFFMAVFLLSAFSIYTGLVLTGIFGRIPCSCGGVVASMGWGAHLVMNLLFLGLGLAGWRSWKKT